jgi:hypothetical protein
MDLRISGIWFSTLLKTVYWLFVSRVHWKGGHLYGMSGDKPSLYRIQVDEIAQTKHRKDFTLPDH